MSLPPPFFDPRAYWTEAPAYLPDPHWDCLMAAIPVAFAWNQWRPGAWSPLREMGYASLFVYWIHVEMAYGRPANAIKDQLSFVEATIGYAILVCVLWGLVRLKAHSPLTALAANPDTSNIRLIFTMRLRSGHRSGEFPSVERMGVGVDHEEAGVGLLQPAEAEVGGPDVRRGRCTAASALRRTRAA